jgi:WD40 repeat protein
MRRFSLLISSDLVSPDPLVSLKTDSVNFECVAILSDGHQRTVRNLGWSNDGQALASCSFDASTCVWRRDADTRDWSCAVSLEGHESEVKAVQFSHDDRLLATCGRDKSVWIWERLGDSNGADDEYECVAVLTDHSQDVKSVRWHPSERLLASCSYDDTIRLYAETGDDWSCVETLTGHSSTVWAIDFNAAGDRLVSCSDDQTIRVWQRHGNDNKPYDWKCVCTLATGHHTRSIYDVSWNPSNDCFATVGRDNALCVFAFCPDSDSYTLIAKQSNAHRMDVNSVHWHPTDTDKLITGGDDRTVCIWQLNSHHSPVRPLL